MFDTTHNTHKQNNKKQTTKNQNEWFWMWLRERERERGEDVVSRVFTTSVDKQRINHPTPPPMAAFK
jgi:hypothetical protein